jgi:hypothetical protein
MIPARVRKKERGMFMTRAKASLLLVPEVPEEPEEPLPEEPEDPEEPEVWASTEAKKMAAIRTTRKIFWKFIVVAREGRRKKL